MRLVLDTNILIAALIKDSITRRILLLPGLEFFSPPLPSMNSLHIEAKLSVPLGSKEMSSNCC
jgi:hypothetical protein